MRCPLQVVRCWPGCAPPPRLCIINLSNSICINQHNVTRSPFCCPRRPRQTNHVKKISGGDGGEPPFIACPQQHKDAFAEDEEEEKIKTGKRVSFRCCCDDRSEERFYYNMQFPAHSSGLVRLPATHILTYGVCLFARAYRNFISIALLLLLWRGKQQQQLQRQLSVVMMVILWRTPRYCTRCELSADHEACLVGFNRWNWKGRHGLLTGRER